LKIACPEEVAFKMGYINDQELKNLYSSLSNSEYREYLKDLIE